MHTVVLITSVSRKKENFNSLSFYMGDMLKLPVFSMIEIKLSGPTHFPAQPQNHGLEKN